MSQSPQTQTPDLFTPLQLGAIQLPNRIIMAPLTRSRAGEGNAPTPLNAEYYAQRASAGLIITEATQVCDTAQGYPNTPGIHTDAQTVGWRAVAEAVHAAGGRIVTQLWHTGRISHPLFQPNGALPLAPSAIAAQGQLYTGQGMEPFPTPRALETAEIPALVRHFADAAKRAVFDAGLDGVEIHGANGYLIDQFLRDRTNHRADQYGGSVENRARFLLEILEATTHAIGADRVGLRLSPTGGVNAARRGARLSFAISSPTFMQAIRFLRRSSAYFRHTRPLGPLELIHQSWASRPAAASPILIKGAPDVERIGHPAWTAPGDGGGSASADG